MDRVYGLVWKKTEEGMKLVCKSCGEYAGLICMFTASSKECLLLVGDIYQLEPVVKEERMDKALLQM